MKTGFTNDAGYGLVGSVMRDGRRLIMVVAGLETANSRKQEAEKLLDWGFRQFKQIDMFDANETVAQARVWGGESKWVDLVTAKQFQIALTPTEQKSVEVKLSYTGPLLAPVKAGEAVGMVKILVRGKAVAEVPVVTANEVLATPSMWSKALDSAMIMVFGG
jgi:serine-type D-Ala-D-Ala carboxypeptidase (penicillin-binding protein 5/6)